MNAIKKQIRNRLIVAYAGLLLMTLVTLFLVAILSHHVRSTSCCSLFLIAGTLLFYGISSRTAFSLYLFIFVMLTISIGSFFRLAIVLYFLFLPGMYHWLFSAALIVSSLLLVCLNFTSINRKHIVAEYVKRGIIDIENHTFNYSLLQNSTTIDYFKKSSPKKSMENRFRSIATKVATILLVNHPVLLGMSFVFGRHIFIRPVDARAYLLALFFIPIITSGLTKYLLLPNFVLLQIIWEHNKKNSVSMKLQ